MWNIKDFENITIKHENDEIKFITTDIAVYNDNGDFIGTADMDITNLINIDDEIINIMKNDYKEDDNISQSVSVLNTNGLDYIPECCRSCSNHPSNGGSGICNCTAPLYDEKYPWKITC